jgi:hypothetical protein
MRLSDKIRLHVFTAALLIALASSGQAQTAQLWSIGTPDQDDSEFALAPGGYTQFRSDAFYVIGRSNPKSDWPYVQPGPTDAWAGNRTHTFTVAFRLDRTPPAGNCRLVADLVDSQSRGENTLRIEINGKAFEHVVPRGASDASVFGQPKKGKPHHFVVEFGADLLRPGVNEIRLTTTAGGWILWDALALQTPAGAALAEPSGVLLAEATAPPFLVRNGGALEQIVRLRVLNLGAPCAAGLFLDGKILERLRLRAGLNWIEASVARVDRERPATVSLEADNRPAGSMSVTLRPIRKWVIYLLPHTHHDIGYTDRQADVLKRQFHNLELAVEGIRKTAAYPPGARFRWNSEVLWAVDHYLREAPREKQRALVQAIRAGEVELDALYCNELTGLCRPEELVQLLSYKPLMEARCGVRMDTAFISDVPAYTWGTASVLAMAGIRYFSMGINCGWNLFRGNWEDKPFYWKSPDGMHKVLCWLPYQGYAMSVVANMKDEQTMMDRLASMERSGYPYDIVQWRWCREDNGAPDVSICDWVRDWNAAHAFPKLVIATGTEAFRAFEAKYRSRIPTVSGDFTPYWEDGAASTARETALNRSSAERLSQAEALYAMLRPHAYPVAAFRKAWTNVVLYDEHTWGAYNSTSEPDIPFVKEQWAVKQAFALDADAESRQLLDRAAGAGGRSPLSAVDVLNTTGWPRTDLVTIPAGRAVAGDAVADGDGTPVPSQRLSSGELVFIARDVPPFGGRRYILRPGSASGRGAAVADRNGVRSGDVAVQIDPATGAIASIRAGARELVDRSSPNAFNDYLYVAGADSSRAQRSGPTSISVQDSGPLVASMGIVSAAPGCRSLTRTVRVVDGIARVEISDSLDKVPILSKEGVHIPFPFSVPDGIMRVDTPWAAVRLERDQLPGACRSWSTVQRWVDVSNSAYGVSWLTLDAPLIEAGAIRAGAPNPEHLQPTQTLYSYVMNNYWDTNYKASQEGMTTFRYAVSPHGPYRGEEVERLGMDYSRPLLVAPAQGSAAPASLLRVEPAGVVVETIKPSDDGRGWIVRLRGASGRAEKAKLHWRAGLRPRMTLTDISERPGTPILGPIDVPPSGLVTVRADRP